MKIHKDCYVAISLFLFCAFGLYGILTTDTLMTDGADAAENLISSLALSYFSIIACALCASLILFRSFFAKKNLQENTKATVKTISYTVLFAFYLISMVFLGEYIVENELLNFTSGGGFLIASTLFAFFSMYILGQRNIYKILCISLCAVFFLFLVFGHFFYILLP